MIWSWNICRITRSHTIQKKSKAQISQTLRFYDFERGLRETERLKNLKKSVNTSGHYLYIMNWSLNDIICNILWPLYLAQIIRSQSQKIVKFVIFEPLIVLNCSRTCDLTDVPASNNDRKTDARPLNTFHDILRFISRDFSVTVLKGRDAPIWRNLELTHIRLSGADGLRHSFSGCRCLLASLVMKKGSEIFKWNLNLIATPP